MTPFFSPDRAELAGFGVPKIFLAGVGTMMTEVAGEVCDGFLCHGFTTERYLREVTLPALARGRAKAGKTMDGFEVVGPSFVVTGTNEEEMAAAAEGTRQQIAFYGSTPAYRGVLELHGWGDLQAELNALSKQGAWVEMGKLITDEVLHTFAVVGEPEKIAPELHRRFGDVVAADQLLRAIQERPGPLGEGPRRPGRRLRAFTATGTDLCERTDTTFGLCAHTNRPLTPSALTTPDQRRASPPAGGTSVRYTLGRDRRPTNLHPLRVLRPLPRLRG